MAESGKPTWRVETRTDTKALEPYAKRIVDSLLDLPQDGLKAYNAAGLAIIEAGKKPPFGATIVIRVLASPKLTGSCVNTLSFCRDMARYWKAAEVRKAVKKKMSRRAVSALLPFNLYAAQKDKYPRITKQQRKQLRSVTSHFITEWPKDGSKDDIRAWYDKVAAWKNDNPKLLGDPRKLRKLHGAVQRLKTAEKTVKATIDGARELLARAERAPARRSGRRIATELKKLRATLEGRISASRKKK
jgi:hypothetical protein